MVIFQQRGTASTEDGWSRLKQHLTKLPLEGREGGMKKERKEAGKEERGRKYLLLTAAVTKSAPTMGQASYSSIIIAPILQMSKL